MSHREREKRNEGERDKEGVRRNVSTGAERRPEWKMSILKFNREVTELSHSRSGLSEELLENGFRPYKHCIKSASHWFDWHKCLLASQMHRDTTSYMVYHMTLVASFQGDSFQQRAELSFLNSLQLWITTSSCLVQRKNEFLDGYLIANVLVNRNESKRLKKKDRKSDVCLFIPSDTFLPSSSPTLTPHSGGCVSPICARLWNISAMQYSAGLSQAFSIWWV